MTNNQKIISEIQKEFINSLKKPERKTQKPIAIAMVGLIGSGKSSVAKALSPLIGAAIISGDAIRIALRKRGQNYNPVRNTIKKAVITTLKAGSNAIIDADFVDTKKVKGLQEKLKKFKLNAKLICIRTVAERDIMIDRLIKAKYNLNKDLFKNATIAIREMWRRTPHHYNWSKAGGGRFVLKKLKIPFIAEIDTTTPEWRKKVREVAAKIRKL